MSQLGFTSMTPGNHEYDWGSEAVKNNADLANFPFLAINIYDRATNQRVDYCDGSLLVEMGDVKIGVIGAIGDCYSSISSDKVTDIYFKTGSALTTLVQNEASSLRAQGADFIIYTIHDGYGSSTSGNISDSQLKSYYDISLSNCVDLVFEGHTHQRYVLKDSKGVYHMQDGGDNDGISHAKVKINFANENSVVQSAKFVSTSVYSGLADDPLVNNLLVKYKDQINAAGEVLGVNAKTRNSTTILKKTAELYYQTGMERWGNKYDIVLGGGFMQARSPYNLYAGEVLYSDLMSVMPFDNQLVLCSISGSNLKSRFFDLPKNYYIYYEDYGTSVKNNIVSSKTYYVVTDTYSLQYTPNGLTEVARYDETTFARDLLAKFIRNGGWSN
jgi:2',3'-cyclic-nucleotide 2'-phosphodiesterase/3'-nucleotidase